MATEYSRALLRVALAQICQSLGWQAVQSTPMELLTCILERYLLEIAKTAHRYANQFGRTEPNLDDLGLTFQDLNVQLEDLSEYVQNVDPLPFVADVPKFPIPKESLLVFPKPNSRELREREEYIDDYLPPMHPDWEEVVQPSEAEPYPLSQDRTDDKDLSVTDVDERSMVPPSTSVEPHDQSTASAGGEKHPDTSPVADESTDNRMSGLPDEAGPHHYKMKSVIMSHSGVLTPTLGIGRLPNMRKSPSPPPRFTIKSQFWPASAKGCDKGKVKIKPVKPCVSKSTKKSSKLHKDSDKSKNKDLRKDKSRSKKISTKSKTKKSTKENTSSIITPGILVPKVKKKKKSQDKKVKASRTLGKSKLKLLLTADTTKSTGAPPSVNTCEYTPPRPYPIELVSPRTLAASCPTSSVRSTSSSPLVDMRTPSPLRLNPISIAAPGTSLIRVDDSDGSNASGLPSFTWVHSEESSNRIRTHLNSYTDSVDGEINVTETIDGEVALGEAIEEEVIITETMDEDIDVEQTIENEVSIGEAITGEIGIEETIAETVAITETVDGEIDLEDTIRVAVDIAETIEEEVSVTETIDEEVVIAQTVEEEVTVAETMEQEVEYSETMEEGVTFCEPVEEEVVSYSDNVEVATYSQTVEQVVNYSDNVEVVDVLDNVEEVVSYSDTVEEVVSYFDTEEQVVSYSETVEEVVAHTEEVEQETFGSSMKEVVERRCEETERLEREVSPGFSSEVDVDVTGLDMDNTSGNVGDQVMASKILFDYNDAKHTPASPTYSEPVKIHIMSKTSQLSHTSRDISGTKPLHGQSGTKHSTGVVTDITQDAAKSCKLKNNQRMLDCTSSRDKAMTGLATTRIKVEPHSRSPSPAPRASGDGWEASVQSAPFNTYKVEPADEECTGSKNTEKDKYKDKEHKKDKKKKKKRDKDKVKSEKSVDRSEKKDKRDKKQKSKKEKKDKKGDRDNEKDKSSDQFIPRLKFKFGGGGSRSSGLPDVCLFSSPYHVGTASTKVSPCVKTLSANNSPISSPQTNTIPKLSLSLQSPMLAPPVVDRSQSRHGSSSRSPSPYGSYHSQHNQQSTFALHSPSSFQSPSMGSSSSRSASPVSPMRKAHKAQSLSGSASPFGMPSRMSSTSQFPVLPPQPSRMVSTSFLPPPPSSAAKKAASEQAVAKQRTIERAEAAARLAVEHAAAQKSARAAAAKILAAKSKNPAPTGKVKKVSSKKRGSSTLRHSPATSPREAQTSAIRQSPALSPQHPRQPSAPQPQPWPSALPRQTLPSTSGTTGVISQTVGTIIDEHGQTIWICPACKRQDDGSPMIGCDDCDDWFHWVCVGLVSPPPDDKQWYCLPCNTNRLIKNAGKKKKRRKKMK